MRTKNILTLVAALAALTLPASADYSGPDLSGQTVTLAGPWLTADEANLNEVIDIFEAATGATVEHAGSDSFEQQIVIDIKAGSPPNIAIFPQPGLAANMAALGGLVPLSDETKAWVQKNYAAGQSWVDLGTYPDENGTDQFYGFFYKVNVKSLVWYSPDNFEENGYDVPETMEDLVSLSKQMIADGNTPWCIGLGSGDATGWPATDWMEDMMLRSHDPAVYDKWVTNEMPFNDPRVIEAMNFFGSFAKDDAMVNGGAAAVATTDFRDSPAGLFTSPAQCMMHRQASFIPAFSPKDLEAGTDYDFFYFPAFAEKDLGRPVLGGGTLFSITKDSEATRAFIDFLKHPASHEAWMAKGGFLTPHKGVDLDKYSSATFKGLGEILLGATTFRFDGSDLMPGAIGAGSFWTGMVDFTSGQSAEEVANAIQASWDAIK